MNIIGSYTWIDNVLVDGMDYFAGMFGYFQDIAWALAMLVFWLGLMINAIKLVFGSESIKKVAIGTLGKLCIFLMLFYGYRRITSAVAHSAMKWGTNAGSGHATVTENLVGLMHQCENDLQVAQHLAKLPKGEQEKQIKAMKKKLADNKKNKTALGKGQGNNFFSDMTSSDGMSMFANQANLYRNLDDIVEYQLQTMNTLREVLAPTKVKDKDGNLIDTYFLATTLYDKNGKPTNYISPAAFLKIAILTGELIIRRQVDYMQIRYGETYDVHIKAVWPAGAFAGIISTFEVYFNLSNLLNFSLCFICMIAVIFCALFAMIQYMMTMFEYAIVTSIVIFYIPFYLADISKSIASKLFPIFWNFFIKLLVITILMWFAIYQYINLASDQMSMGVPFSPTVFATTMFSILLSFIVTQNGPKVAQTIISGNPELSMGEFLQAAGTMAAGGAIMGKAAQAGSRSVAGGAFKAMGEGVGHMQKAKAEGKSAVEQVGSFLGGAAKSGAASMIKTPFSAAGKATSRVLFGKQGGNLAEKFAEGFENSMRQSSKKSNKDEDNKNDGSDHKSHSGENDAPKFNGDSQSTQENSNSSTKENNTASAKKDNNEKTNKA